MKPTKLLFLAFATFSTLNSNAFAVERPDQYIVFAFDGSKSLEMWDETRKFADDMTNGVYAPLPTPTNPNPTAKRMPLKFTYFINADYYLANKDKHNYIAPHIPDTTKVNIAGASAIGFGGDLSEVEERFQKTNEALAHGNEIANHAAGHFDGSKWTREEWHEEFREFYDLIFNPIGQNQATLSFRPDEIIGFRAPQLGNDPAMYQELPNPGFEAGKMDTGHILYDTSQTSQPNLWPAKKANMWQFPLADISIVGTVGHNGQPRKNLAMDYNFYFVQTDGKDIIQEMIQEKKDNDLIAKKVKQLEDQMFYSYVNYFFDNYNGNRAPVNIGHHFSKWNGGAYWNAMRRLARLVCGLPEVKCTTYRDLMAYMEEPSTKANLQAYQMGMFQKTAYKDYPQYVQGRANPMPVLYNQTDDDYNPNVKGMNDPQEAHESSDE